MRRNLLIIIFAILCLAGCTNSVDTTMTVEKAEILNQGYLAGKGRLALLKVNLATSDKVPPSHYAFLEKNPSQKLIDFFEKIKPGDKIIIKGTYQMQTWTYNDDQDKDFNFDEIIIIGSGERYKRY